MQQIQKLKGFEFWKSIGSPKYICAPMVAQSELAFRNLVSKYGCDISYSPMVLTSSYLNSKKEQETIFSTCEHEKRVIVQLAGNNKENLLKVAENMLNKYQNIIAFDLNLGCPQLFAGKNQYGAYMLDNPIQVSQIIQFLDQNLKVPLFIKIRVQKDDNKTLEMVKLFEQCGAQCITVHGRTKENIHDKIGACNWEIIKRIKEISNVPIIANGGMHTQEDIEKCLQYTKCDAVMSAEALLENPKLFDFTVKNGNIDDQYNDEYIKDYLEICQRKCCQPNIKEIKLHLKVFFYNFLQEDLQRDKYFTRKLGEAKTIEGHINIAYEMLDKYQQYVRNNSKIGWYKRHKTNSKKKFTDIQNNISNKNNNQINNCYIQKQI